MSLTRIGSIGINTGIAFAGVTTIVTLNTANDALSIGSTVNVGSGITLGASGDIFATGVCTAASFSGSGANLTGIDTDLVSDTSPQLGGNLDVNTKNIVFGDSGSASDDRLTFGAGTDLSIYHNGSNSYIDDSGTGNLFIRSNEVRINKYTNEYMIRAVADGAVELYHDNSKKLETTSYGTLVTGRLTTTGNITAPDSAQIQLGDSIDLAIYHDGSHSRIVDSGTGHLIIQTSELDLMNAAGNADLIKATEGGSVELYENGTKVAETTSGGWNVEGYTYTNGLDMDDNHKILLGTGDDMQLYHDGTTSRLHSASHNISIRSGGTFGVFNGDGTETLLTGEPNGAVKLYHNDGKRLETFDLGIDIGVNATGNFGIRWGGANYNYANIWTEYGSGDIFIAGGLKQKTTNGGFFSSYGASLSRNAIQIDAFGNEGIHFYASAAQNVAKDDAITVPERVRINQHGLTFNGDSAAANALDDYEEGTFTATISSGGTVSSFTHNKCAYIRIGRQVMVQMYLQFTGSGNGNIFKIGSLPFAAANYSTYGFGGFSIVYQNNSFQATDVGGHVQNLGTDINFYKGDGNVMAGNGGNLFGGADFIIIGQYQAQ